MSTIIVDCDAVRQRPQNMAVQSNCKQNHFRRLFSRALTSASASSGAPPPYSGTTVNDSKTEKAQPSPTPQSPPPPPIPEDKFPDIEALSVPQWTWTNEQCREWLRKFLVVQCGRSVEYASEKASKLEGFGANVYLRRFAAWKQLLGFVDADGIYALGLAYRKKKGVIPEGIKFNHPESAKRS